jgi:serine/threonine protein kinase
MLGRLAQKKKAETQSKAKKSVISTGQMEQRIQNEIRFLNNEFRNVIDLSKFVNLEDLYNVSKEELVIIKRTIDHYVFNVTVEIHFPNIDNMLSFVVVIQYTPMHRGSIHIIAGEENISLVENNLSPSALFPSRIVKTSDKPLNLNTVCSNPTTFSFSILVTCNYPYECPQIKLIGSNCQNKEYQINCALEQSFSDHSSHKDMKCIIDNLVKMVVDAEKEELIKELMTQSKEILKLQKEYLNDTRFLVKDYENIQEGHFLIKSENGTVRMATYNSYPVTIRTSLYKSDESELPELISEINSLCKLSHPNLINYKGYFLIRERFHLKVMMEQFSNNSLYRILHDPKSKTTLSGLKKKLSNQMVLLKIAIDLASGLEYLHSQGIVYRNLRSNSVFIADDLTTKLFIDLKYCYYFKEGEIDEFHGGKSVGSIQYKAPEEFTNSIQNRKVDVYSFGVLLNELYSQTEPWKRELHSEIPKKVLEQQLRPDLAFSAPKEVLSLIKDCWRQEPSERPSFKQILVRLQALQS